MKKIILGFLLFGFICSVFSTPLPDTEDPNYQDDQEYDQEYDEPSESDESKNKIMQTDLTGTLQLREYFIRSKQGDTVELDCLKYLETNAIKDNLVLIWYNDTTSIATGSFITGDQNRLEYGKNQNLIIKSVNEYDTGRYKCEIHGLVNNLEIIAKLEVNTPPKVEILANKRIVTGNTLDYKEQARIELECRASGNPKPSIRWSIGGKLIETKNGVEVQGGNLVITHAGHHHSGDYQCLAENNLNQLDHGVITIRISYAPRIKIHKKLVNSMEGSDRALHCLYHSNPDAKIVWEKNHTILQTNEKYDIYQDEHHGENRSVLVVKKINDRDLGVYQCKAQNVVGSAMGNVTLIFTPEPARFIETKIDGKHVQISWEIHSMLPLSEIILYYRKKGETPWAKDTGLSHKRNETHGIYNVSHKLQLEPGVWEARIKSKNRVGESVMSEAEVFTVHSVIDLDIDDENATGTQTDGGSRLELQSSIILCVGFEIVRRLLFTY